MKLAEALRERADLIKRVSELEARIKENVRLQEGDVPAENPEHLLAEVDLALVRLEYLIAKINQTNLRISLEDGVSLTEALARRDVLKLQASVWRRAATAAIGASGGRVTRTEIKFVSLVDVKETHARADQHAKELRLLDSKIQMANWQNELIEE